jgi:hypothetical protein
VKGGNAMLKGTYLKVKELFPVYDTYSKVYYDPSFHDKIFIKGVNVTVDVDKEFEKQRGPIMARPTTLPCRAYQVLDIEEYTKNIQDEVFKAIRKLRSGIVPNERNLYFKGMTSGSLIDNYTGSEFMAMYEKYQEGTQKKRDEELQKKIKEAKKLLEENGYIVGMKEDA